MMDREARGHKESDITEQLNWTEHNHLTESMLNTLSASSLSLGVIPKHVSKISMQGKREIRMQGKREIRMHLHDSPEETISDWIMEYWFSDIW